MTPTPESELTERQKDVLRLVRAEKSPTDIGRELGISSQAVHGHLKRLRAHGLIEGEAPASASKPAARRPKAANGRPPFDPAATIAAVQAAIAEQHAQLDAREGEIDAEIERLRAEKKAIAAARKELARLTPGVSSEAA